MIHHAFSLSSTIIYQHNKHIMSNTSFINIWDPIVRIFHWTVVTSFIGAYISSDDVDIVHHVFGYIILGCVTFRILWGIIGSHYAKFSEFIVSPKTLLHYLKAMWHRKETRYLGHNPAGGYMIITLIALLLTTTISGWLLRTDWFWGNELMETIHHTTANITVGMVMLHILGALYASIHHKENLIKAMITGKKINTPTNPTPPSPPQATQKNDAQ
jgi:cytochrome b